MASATDTMKQIVLAAFPVEPVPQRLFWSSSVDHTGEFPADFQRFFAGRPWTAISELDWRWCSLGGAFREYAEPSTYLYYLPSLIFEAIDCGDIQVALECILPDNRQRVPKGQWWAEFFEAASPAQRSALASFLAYLRRERSTEIDAAMIDVQLSAAEAIWLNDESNG